MLLKRIHSDFTRFPTFTKTESVPRGEAVPVNDFGDSSERISCTGGAFAMDVVRKTQRPQRKLVPDVPRLSTR